jgi:hemerythrin
MNTWDDKLTTGNEEIDSHHKELFHLDSLLDTALQSGKIDPINDIIEFLEHYVVDHFQEEETLMKSNNYKGYIIHKKEHDEFKVVVGQLRKRFNDDFPLAHVIFQTRRLLDDLVRHIKSIDVGIKHLEDK